MKKDIPDLDIHPRGKQNYERIKGVKKLILKVLPLNIITPLKFELYMAYVRLKSIGKSREYENKKDLLVNIGAGGLGKEGWINIDIKNYKNINCVYDARRHLPFPDGSVNGIFSEHFFEHLDYTEEVPYFLSECHRVLKHGGVLRLIVPDAGRYLSAYTKGGWDELKKMRQLNDDLIDKWYKSNYTTPMELINFVFRQGSEHKYAYDFETIEFLLNKYSFGKVKKQKFGKSIMPEIAIDREIRASESLYVDAVK